MCVLAPFPSLPPCKAGSLLAVSADAAAICGAAEDIDIPGVSLAWDLPAHPRAPRFFPMANSLPLFDALTDSATEAQVEAASDELIRDAHARAFCRETLAMLAENYQDEAVSLSGPRATALRWASRSILSEA